MLRYAPLLLAAVLVGCSSPSTKESGTRSARSDLSLTANEKTKSGKKPKTDSGDPTKKTTASRPATQKEVGVATKEFLNFKDVQITAVSDPLDLPEKVEAEVAAKHPDARNVKAYYVSFVRPDPEDDSEKVASQYLLIVGREQKKVKVLEHYDTPSAIESKMGSAWVKENAPPKK